jgi:hypothetical protein
MEQTPFRQQNRRFCPRSFLKQQSRESLAYVGVTG